MLPPKRTRNSVDRFDPHPPGSSHEMGADRVRKGREKRAERDRKRKERGADPAEDTGKDQAPVEKGGTGQEDTLNNNIQPVVSDKPKDMSAGNPSKM